MIYLNKRITFDIYLLKSEISQLDYILLFEDTDPSNVVQVGFQMRAIDVGDNDPSQGDSWLFSTSTQAADTIETRSFYYNLYDEYGNTDYTSNSFDVEVCLVPSKPTLDTPAYSEGAGELTFDISQ